MYYKYLQDITKYYTKAFKSVLGNAIANKEQLSMMQPTNRNGGKHPTSIKNGNTTFPITAPHLPTIITKDIAITLQLENFVI